MRNSQSFILYVHLNIRTKKKKKTYFFNNEKKLGRKLEQLVRI